MPLRILFISTKYTGHGHQSITDALTEQLQIISPQTEIEVIEGFDLGGRLGRFMGHLYGPLTQHARPLWASCYHTFRLFPGLFNKNTAFLLRFRREFRQVLTKTNPDLIVTVHPGFVGSVINVLQHYRLSIPVVPIIADLISINSLWSDSRAYCTISPTEEARDRIINQGVPPDKIKVFRFPVRRKFSEPAAKLKEEELSAYRLPDRLNFLLISGAEGTGNLSATAQTLLRNFDCRVTIITGRNKQLQSSLKSSLLPMYPDRAVVLGFVDNIEEYLLTSDLLITRASPNTMMEAITCCVPLVVTDAVPGQERENPDYIVKHGLGITCRDILQLPREIKRLLAEDGRLLRQIRLNQYYYRDLQASRKLASFLLEAAVSFRARRLSGTG